MSNIEFLKINELNTTTMVAVSSGTTTVSKLFNRQTYSDYYESSGFSAPTAGVTIGVEFAIPTNISRIALQGINLKSFKVYYNSNTANTFTLLNNITTLSDWVSNSETSLYLKFATISANSVFIVSTITIDADVEKRVSQFWICDHKFTFTNNPDHRGYKPKFDTQEVVHDMAGGGTTKYVFGDAYDAKISLKYQSQTMFDHLYDVYRARLPVVAAIFPTGTSWEGTDIYEINWIGDFNFKQPAGNNYSSLGYSGSFRIEEAAK